METEVEKKFREEQLKKIRELKNHVAPKPKTKFIPKTNLMRKTGRGR